MTFMSIAFAALTAALAVQEPAEQTPESQTENQTQETAAPAEESDAPSSGITNENESVDDTTDVDLLSEETETASPAACDRSNFVTLDRPAFNSREKLSIRKTTFDGRPTEATYSQVNANAFWVKDPNTTPDPQAEDAWDASLMAARPNGKGFLINAKETAGPIYADWVSENLLYARVQWGQLAFTDLLMDLENRKVVYNRDILFACRE